MIFGEKTDYFVVEPCTSANGIEIKLKEKKLDLKRTAEVLSKMGLVAASSPVFILAKIGKYSISAYASGRLMIKSQSKSNKKIEDKKIEVLAKKLISAFEEAGAIV